MKGNFYKESPLVLPKVRLLDRFMTGHRGFVAGGCFKNIFSDTKLKDIDLFFEESRDFEDAEIYFNESDNFSFCYKNDNCISYIDKDTQVRVELIHKTFGTPESILEMFDFTITKVAYFKEYIITEDGTESVYSLLIHEKFFQDLVNKKLVIDDKLLFPVSSFERSYRYAKYGFGLCKESKGLLIEALRTADTNDLSDALYNGID